MDKDLPLVNVALLEDGLYQPFYQGQPIGVGTDIGQAFFQCHKALSRVGRKGAIFIPLWVASKGEWFDGGDEIVYGASR